MEVVVLSFHLLVSICLIGLVLLQRSEGGALGMGGGGGGSLMSGRGASDALARMTSIAGGFFLVTSLGLTVLSGSHGAADGRSILDMLPQQQRSAPAVPTPAPVEPTRPDPTESSLPSDTQLASLEPAAETPVVAPPATQAAERAGPLAAPPVRAQPASTTPPRTVTSSAAAPPNRAASTPTQPATLAAAPPRTQPPAASPPRSQPVATNPPRPAASQPTAAQRSQTVATNPPRTPPLVLPNTSGAGTGLNTQTPESVNTGVEAVRRERAGPDQ
jgi:preprotein translocase subunit SecG